MSEFKKVEEILELSPDLLELVSGGVVTETAASTMNGLIKVLKEHEYTPEVVIEYITSNLMENPLFEGITAEEVADYVNTNW